jgi:5-methylcytosine-specific restriction endonuclease McrA
VGGITSKELIQGIVEKIPMGVCAYCETPIFRRLKKRGKRGIRPPVTPFPDDEATIDHLVPKSKGGKNEGNTYWVCNRCNNEKGDLYLEEFIVSRLVIERPE